MSRFRLMVAATAAASVVAALIHAPAALAAGPNLAAGKTFSASSYTDVYPAGNAGDGNANSYWESNNNAFPQWLQVDLGTATQVNQAILKLPPATAWSTRTETLAIQGSTNGTSFSDLKASAGYTFNPSSGNTVTVDFTAASARFVRLTFTGNTSWPAGQLSELELYGPVSGDSQAPSAPGGLAYTQPASGQIRLSWNASTDNVGVTGYDIYANGQLRTSVAGNVLTYTDSQPDSATVAYYVRAKDAAGNVSANSSTVTRTGASGDSQAPTTPGTLSYTTPAAGQIRLSWGASTDNVGVTGYNVYANGTLTTTVTGTTYTDSQPDTATVAYYVKAKDAAGNESAASNTVTRTGAPQTGANLAVGKPIEASSSIFTFVATNANDNDTATYWEGSAYPANLTVKLGANATVSSVVVKLNPATDWGTRQQTFAVLGREQSATAYTTIVGSATYTFNPSSQNTVTIPVSATTADVRLSFTANTGAPSGQVAEFQVIGAPAANPDLTVTGLSFAPAAPVETDAVTLSATVRNAGTAASPASSVNFYLGTTKVGTATVGALAAGAASTVSASIGARDAGSYTLSAKVDEANTVIETNDANNSYTSPANLVVAPVSSSDLVASAVSWSPGNPAAGNTVTFAATLKNQGTAATAGGAHAVTVTVLNGSATVKTFTGSYTGSLAAGASSPSITLGTWTAVNGKYTVRTVVATDANELPVKQDNNTSEKPFFVGRGANMPYDMYEAEDGTTGGGAAVLGPNRTVGDLAGEASGRKAVTLNQTGSYVQWTTRNPTNTVVARFSIPDGTTSSINVYVNGTLNKSLPLTSKYAWLYGNETAPQNSGTGPRHIYDEANILLTGSFPAGSTIKLQKDSGNSGSIAIDFINLEQVAPLANPDAARYVVPAGFDQQSVQNALDAARQDASKLGVYLPAGDYQTANKFQVYGRSLRVVGAGPWYTRFHTPDTQTETDAGFRADATANGSTFANFAFFGNYTIRIDGPGKVFDFANVANVTIDNIWAEHVVCLYWGANTDNMVIKNSRIRDTFADGVNMTNGSTGNLVDNNDARSTGDDAFALFSAIDAGGSDEINNTFSNLSTTLTWRAAGVAVYGGYANTFKNIYIADTLVYSGITISSLDFGYPMNGFGANPPTVFDNISIVRAGGHFWGAQVFPAIWMFSASKVFQGIRVSNVDIVDPTYSGIMFQTQYIGGNPVNPITDSVFTNVTITGAQKSGDAFDAKSGYGIWANPLPETGQGPAVGSATFTNLQMSNNFKDIENPTSTFTITRN
ncbi:discoidin domain-containing protein [Actinoplanes awajinensis]|uniref:Secreted glycosyl hydrolase n=1 Tax=Actinoplanes awajinensis subsp. mycoplanecinus TaxID=135947 RepID=A0A0X3VDC7_9ACTN|nr:discoidin domain-containing protein [Actinoplanes awajinensis]KUL42272.1 Secreted glycosyl hydrolase [Actinoplanes awajinensis subsp. mycoplanecinus]